MPTDILNNRRRIWKTKGIIRRLYSRWYGLIGTALRPGRTLELGGGSGNLKEFFPGVISSDIVLEPWLDAVLDAQRLCFRDESFDNIVLFDVLHHLEEPTRFFSEARRILRRRGRIVMMEPYVSLLSFFIYQFLHSEGMNWFIDPFQGTVQRGEKEPFQGNQAIPTLIFRKYRKKFLKDFPDLSVIQEQMLEILIYPLSGGFHNPNRCPSLMLGMLEHVERWLSPLNRFLAFRLFLILEKR